MTRTSWGVRTGTVVVLLVGAVVVTEGAVVLVVDGPLEPLTLLDVVVGTVVSPATGSGSPAKR